MTINELLNAFKDIDFQANRMLKTKTIDLNYLQQFDLRTEEIRLQILQMDLSEDINDTFKKIERIELEHLPNFTLIDKTANLLTFGLSKKKENKKENGFLLPFRNLIKKNFFSTYRDSSKRKLNCF